MVYGGRPVFGIHVFMKILMPLCGCINVKLKNGRGKFFVKKIKIKITFGINLDLPISDTANIPEWSDQDCNGAIDNMIFRGEL